MKSLKKLISPLLSTPLPASEYAHAQNFILCAALSRLLITPVERLEFTFKKAEVKPGEGFVFLRLHIAFFTVVATTLWYESCGTEKRLKIPAQLSLLNPHPNLPVFLVDNPRIARAFKEEKRMFCPYFQEEISTLLAKTASVKAMRAMESVLSSHAAVSGY